MAWFDTHRDQLGIWAQQIGRIATRYQNPTQYERHIGRYILWCLESGVDPKDPDKRHIDAYLHQYRNLNGRRSSGGTLDDVRCNIKTWHRG